MQPAQWLRSVAGIIIGPRSNLVFDLPPLDHHLPETRSLCIVAIHELVAAADLEAFLVLESKRPEVDTWSIVFRRSAHEILRLSSQIYIQRDGEASLVHFDVVDSSKYR
jgi:hypothetical protein